MNILFLADYSVNPLNGGISRITQTLADLFTEKGNRVWYLAYKKVSEDCEERQLYFPYRHPVMENGHLEYLRDIIISKQIDIVIVQTPRMQYMKMLLECKKQRNFIVITCFHNLILSHVYNYAYCKEYELKKHGYSLLFSILKNKIINKILVTSYIYKNRKIHHFIVNNSDATVVLSNGHKDELLKMIGEKVDNTIHIIPNCVNKAMTNCGNKHNEIVWVGRIDCSVKRADFMLDIWSKLAPKHPDWCLKFLGDGPEKVELIRDAEKRNIKNVFFVGRVTPDKYYDSAKILCVTSVHESFSLVTIEAKMHGVVPIIQNSFPIAKEIVNDKADGVLVNPFDKRDFCRKLDDLMLKNKKLKQLSSNAIVDADRYSPERVYEMWNDLFSKTTSGH